MTTEMKRQEILTTGRPKRTVRNIRLEYGTYYGVVTLHGFEVKVCKAPDKECWSKM